MSSKPLTQDHLRAYRSNDRTKAGLLLRAEYCDFMARGSDRPGVRALWELSAARRRQEAAGAK